MLKFVLFLSLAAVCFCVPSTLGESEARLFNGAKLSTSGISAGGFAAQQFAVAFSSNVSGVGVFAGGVYYCSQGSERVALAECAVIPSLIDVSILVARAKQFAAEGKIDDVSNLVSQRVYLYSGTKDVVVRPGSVRKIEEFYAKLGGKVVKSEFSIPSAHGLPTLNYGLECDKLASPFILKCDYDGAGEALKTIYGFGVLKEAVEFTTENFILLKQKSFLDPTKSTEGLADIAYAYIPTGCKSNQTVCDIHVVWHGCNQNENTIKTAYIEHGGYDGYAEANNIIVLYPQSARSIVKNPQACFDWWGYTGDDFAFKSSSQMSTVMNMVVYLASGGR